MKGKIMSKRTILSTMGILALTPIATTLLCQLSASADTAPVPQSISTQEGTKTFEKNKVNTNDATSTLKQELSSLAETYSSNRSSNGEFGLFNLILSGSPLAEPWSFNQTPLAKVNDDMQLKDGNTLAAHSATLNNDTGTDQTLSTASFEYDATDSVTTSTTHSAGVSETTSAEMTFPIAKGSISVTAKYDFSTTKAVTSSETRKWVVPAQPIKVPAGRHYRVSWVLNTGIATGTTELTSRVNAVIPYKHIKDVRYGESIGNAINGENKLENKLSDATKWYDKGKWSVVDSGTALRKWDVATYTAKYGTDLVMNVEDVTNTKSSPILVKSIPMNVTPTTIR